MQRMANRLYNLTDKGPLRVLSLVAALLVAGGVIWDPTRFALSSRSLSLWGGIALIWAVCAGVIHGTGFRPRRALWQGIFNPVLAWVILLPGIACFFSR